MQTKQSVINQLGKDKKEIARSLYHKFDYDTALIANILCVSEGWIKKIVGHYAYPNTKIRDSP